MNVKLQIYVQDHRKELHIKQMLTCLSNLSSHIATAKACDFILCIQAHAFTCYQEDYNIFTFIAASVYPHEPTALSDTQHHSHFANLTVTGRSKSVGMPLWLES